MTNNKEVQPMTVEHVTTATDDARTLIGELDAVLHADSPPENRHGYSVERVFQPDVLFFIARIDGQPVGCGAIALTDQYAEVKRMYVRPHARGKHVAQAVLDRLEAEAQARGTKRLLLETGDNRDAAIRFYERNGFTRCSAFGPYLAMSPYAIAHSVFFEKHMR
jgi:putative acetyltransferase